jgi:hypothetical protein
MTPTLESGLTDHVEDGEILSRFLTQKDHYKRGLTDSDKIVAKAAAFLPYPRYKNSSVFRKRQTDLIELQEVWSQLNTSGRQLKGIAFVVTRDVRNAGVEVTPEEPPPAHANIEGWPWHENDPLVQKSEQLEIANQIAAKAEVVLV